MSSRWGTELKLLKIKTVPLAFSITSFVLVSCTTLLSSPEIIISSKGRVSLLASLLADKFSCKAMFLTFGFTVTVTFKNIYESAKIKNTREITATNQSLYLLGCFGVSVSSRWNELPDRALDSASESKALSGSGLLARFILIMSCNKFFCILYYILFEKRLM